MTAARQGSAEGGGSGAAVARQGHPGPGGGGWRGGALGVRAHHGARLLPPGAAGAGPRGGEGGRRRHGRGLGGGARASPPLRAVQTPAAR
eukprot:5534261-Pleurochrysis_carterae.AAC.1